VIKVRSTGGARRYQPTPGALAAALFKGACVGSGVAFVLVKLWSVLQSAAG
jgi:hypothetical protein